MQIVLTALMLGTLAVSTVTEDLKAIRAVEPHARGTAQARAARDNLVRGGAQNLIPVLKAFQGASPLAKNWLRNVVDAIADAEIKTGRFLPKDDLLRFIQDRSNSPEARRLAYEWLLIRTPEIEEQLIPEMLLDPSPEFRRDAVARLLKEAAEADGEQATAIYQKALAGAVHEDQVKTIAKALRDAGIDVDVQRHFGFLTSWMIIGPFDNRDKKGFAAVYPPEETVDLKAEYDGQLGKVRWQPISTDKDDGLIDIATQIENYKGSLMYATTVFHSDRDQDVEFRLGTPNAWKLWVNGRPIFEREEYHRGTRMDQYRVPVSLKAGPNRILLKICQNEQDDSWAQRYQFQLRVCDSTGSGISSSPAPSSGRKGASSK